jgi:hypothetical protein
MSIAPGPLQRPSLCPSCGAAVAVAPMHHCPVCGHDLRAQPKPPPLVEVVDALRGRIVDGRSPPPWRLRK